MYILPQFFSKERPAWASSPSLARLPSLSPMQVRIPRVEFRGSTTEAVSEMKASLLKQGKGDLSGKRLECTGPAALCIKKGKAVHCLYPALSISGRMHGEFRRLMTTGGTERLGGREGRNPGPVPRASKLCHCASMCWNVTAFGTHSMAPVEEVQAQGPTGHVLITGWGRWHQLRGDSSGLELAGAARTARTRALSHCASRRLLYLGLRMRKLNVSPPRPGLHVSLSPPASGAQSSHLVFLPVAALGSRAPLAGGPRPFPRGAGGRSLVCRIKLLWAEGHAGTYKCACA